MLDVVDSQYVAFYIKQHTVIAHPESKRWIKMGEFLDIGNVGKMGECFDLGENFGDIAFMNFAEIFQGIVVYFDYHL